MHCTVQPANVTVIAVPYPPNSPVTHHIVSHSTVTQPRLCSATVACTARVYLGKVTVSSEHLSVGHLLASTVN
jgi:hypothetical protein